MKIVFLPAIYHVMFRVRDNAGTECWTKTCTLTLGETGKRPFATLILDEELQKLPIKEGNMTIEATLEAVGDLPGSRLEVPVFSAANHPRINGKIQVIGLSPCAHPSY
jgi:hypothetical protein